MTATRRFDESMDPSRKTERRQTTTSQQDSQLPGHLSSRSADEVTTRPTGNASGRRHGGRRKSLASWHPEPAEIRLTFRWDALGVGAGDVELWAPPIEDFQAEARFGVDESIPVAPGKGWLFLLRMTDCPGS